MRNTSSVPEAIALQPIAMRLCWAFERPSTSNRSFSRLSRSSRGGTRDTMADTTQRGASSGPGGGPAVILPDPVRDHLPLARAARVIAVVVLAGALFGYDQGVISGALLGIQKAFAVGAGALEIVTSWVTLGAMFGSLAGGYVADHFGRKRALLVAAGLFVVGRLGRGLRARRAGPRPRPPGGRRRRRRGGGPALCRGARAGRAAGAVRLVLSARDHDRHLHRLSRRRGARGTRAAGGRCSGFPLSPGFCSRSPF